jgi:hypothetical protein
LNEKRIGLSLTGAIIILSISILYSASQISSAIRDPSVNTNGSYDYELSRFNDNFEELLKTLQKNNKSNE